MCDVINLTSGGAPGDGREAVMDDAGDEAQRDVRTAVAAVRQEVAQRLTNDALWRRTDLVERYATRDLRPVEVMLLIRYREALSGRVLELGCGAGRVTGYLAELASHAHGLVHLARDGRVLPQQVPAGELQPARPVRPLGV